MDLPNANILFKTLYHSSGNCYHRGKLGRGCSCPSYIVSETAYESTISSKYFDIILKVQMTWTFFFWIIVALHCFAFFFFDKGQSSLKMP